MSSEQESKTHFRACHLCEAICGLTIETEGDAIVSIKGDPEDPFSRGHICPKAIALQDLHTDPDRLRVPVKKVDGRWQEMDWEEAYELVAQRLHEIQARCGDDSVGVYAGNPNVHNYGHITHGIQFNRLLNTKNRFSATSVDQLPQHVVSYWMYGHQYLIPIPDIDHTDLFVIIGANPMASNGSLMTAPDMRHRLKAIRSRQGKIIVIDPRVTETAKIADQHIFIRPGSDAALLLALINEIFRTSSANPGHLKNSLRDYSAVENVVAPFTAARVAQYSGIECNTIRILAAEIADARRASIYGRIGISTQEYGSLCHWAVQILNLITGNLDAVGGTMVTHPAINPAGPDDRSKGHLGKWHSRVRQLPEFGGELPCSAMAEEILTPGDGQIKAMVIVAGNPVLSTPSGHQLEKALESLQFMVCVDPYINETTCHADIILPPASPLVHGHYDLVFHRLAIRNTTRFNRPVFAKPEKERYDWEIFTGLTEALALQRGMEVKPHKTPEELVKMWIDFGPYSDPQKNKNPLCFDDLLVQPHGVDLGPLRPSLVERLCTDDKFIHCLPEAISVEIKRLEGAVDQFRENGQLLLIGRRDMRTNNSWMHNSYRLVKGKPRCVLLVHPEDLKTNDVVSGENVILASAAGEITVQVEATTDMMRGVVCLPHGWGHDRKGARLHIAEQYAGVSMNDITDCERIDPLSGNAVLSGIAVTLEKGRS